VTMISSARAALRARRRQYEARAELERQQVAVRQRDEFLAMLGHELRNPLSGILLAGEQLERGNGDAERSRAVIARQGRVLTRLVDDLLDVARVTTGKIVLQREPLELNELVARCASNARTGLEQSGSTIAVERSPGRLLVDGDPVRLEQVFGNLIRNAIKYSDGRAIIQISIEQRDDRAVVRVRDQGIGMAPEIIHRVFDLFCQAERALDRAQGGLGIGLTLVKSLVELHGGTVRAASGGLGAGSEFTVELPLGAEARATAPLDHDQDRAAQRPLHILVIEDNTDTRELLRSLFESWQHQVEVASDGLEGVERASRLHPDAVIVDLGLPVIDGLEVARRLRDQFGQDLLLVAVTGYGQLEDKRRSYEAGFDAHFTKPLDVRQLRELLSARFASPDLGVC
jgi:CheY-like chemotaxis protein